METGQQTRLDATADTLTKPHKNFILTQTEFIKYHNIWGKKTKQWRFLRIFVAVVGATRPKQVFYGNNRADFSFIPGNVAPGLLFRKPDHFENYDDWPFLWGQNEGTIAGNTQYIIFGSSLKDIIKK